MKGDFIWKEMEQNDADGVDFIESFPDENGEYPVISSYSKAQWERHSGILKTNRVYWKIGPNGKQYV